MIIEANLHWRYYETPSNLVLPWYTLSCLEWLKQQDVRKWSVFEYGGGYSTIWWRASAMKIRSVEHDPAWAHCMGCEFVPEKQLYIEAPTLGWPYDCIIIDGLYREECAVFAKDCLADGGYMIIDNWDEPDGFPVDPILNALQGWQLNVYSQYNHSNWRTAVFRRTA